MIKQPRIAPSVLAADFAHLGRDLALVAEHVDLFHIDVMDGHFVPNISLGVPVIAAMRPVTDVPFDCHLMMTNADAYFEPLREAGADLVTVHMEAYPDPRPTARKARDLGLGFGLVVNPPTPVEALEPFLDLCDMVVVMSVHPGFGGQRFLDTALPKLQGLRKLVDSAGLATDIQIDGGIDPVTARIARAAGADVFVAGTSVFRATDPVAAIEEIRESAGAR